MIIIQEEAMINTVDTIGPFPIYKLLGSQELYIPLDQRNLVPVLVPEPTSTADSTVLYSPTQPSKQITPAYIIHQTVGGLMLLRVSILGIT